MQQTLTNQLLHTRTFKPTYEHFNFAFKAEQQQQQVYKAEQKQRFFEHITRYREKKLR